MQEYFITSFVGLSKDVGHSATSYSVLDMSFFGSVVCEWSSVRNTVGSVELPTSYSSDVLCTSGTLVGFRLLLCCSSVSRVLGFTVVSLEFSSSLLVY